MRAAGGPAGALLAASGRSVRGCQVILLGWELLLPAKHSFDASENPTFTLRSVRNHNTWSPGILTWEWETCITPSHDKCWFSACQSLKRQCFAVWSGHGGRTSPFPVAVTVSVKASVVTLCADVSGVREGRGGVCPSQKLHF